MAESRVGVRSDEPSYLVNIDPATASRGGGGGWRHESAGVAGRRASEAGTGTARAASAVRGAVVEDLHSSGLAAEGEKERGAADGREEGENPREETARRTRSTESVREKKRSFFFSLPITLRTFIVLFA